MFIKHGDGKIMTVMPEDELTEDQKKAAKDLSEQMSVQSSTDQVEPSKDKKSGN